MNGVLGACQVMKLRNNLQSNNNMQQASWIEGSVADIIPLIVLVDRQRICVEVIDPRVVRLLVKDTVHCIVVPLFL